MKIEALIAKFKKMDIEIQQGVKDQVEDTVKDIEFGAIQNINSAKFVDKGVAYQASIMIAQSIQSKTENEGFTGRIDVNAGNFGAYLEFGTGLSAAQYVPTLPKEWQDMARKFYINGKGTLVKTPYLFPAYQKEYPKFIEGLKKVLKDKLK